MHHCPKCKSTNIVRSRAKSKWESWRKAVTGKRLFRCRACAWRGWGVDMGQTFAEAELASPALAPERPHRRGTAPAPNGSGALEIDLHALDVLKPVANEKTTR